MSGLIEIVFTLIIFAIVARSILSFIVPMSGGRPHPMLISINTLIIQITDPIITPIRRVLPTFGVLDLSPMAAIILLIFIRWALLRTIN